MLYFKRSISKWYLSKYNKLNIIKSIYWQLLQTYDLKSWLLLLYSFFQVIPLVRQHLPSILFFFFFFNRSILDYNVVLASGRIYNIYIYVCVCVYPFFRFFFHYRYLQDIEYSSLYYRAGSHCLSSLYIYIAVCRRESQIPNSISLHFGSPKTSQTLGARMRLCLWKEVSQNGVRYMKTMTGVQARPKAMKASVPQEKFSAGFTRLQITGLPLMGMASCFSEVQPCV